MRDGQLRLPDLRPLLLKGLDILCIVAPLSAAVAGETLSRGSYREVSADIAVAGLAMLFMQFALSGRFKFVSGNIGIDSLMRFHQMAARLVLGLLIMHPFLLVTQRPGCCNFRGTDCHIPRQATGGIAAVTFGMHHVLNVGASRTYPLTPSHPHRHSSSSSPGCVRRGRRVKSDQQRARTPKPSARVVSRSICGSRSSVARMVGGRALADVRALLGRLQSDTQVSIRTSNCERCSAG